MVLPANAQNASMRYPFMFGFKKLLCLSIQAGNSNQNQKHPTLDWRMAMYLIGFEVVLMNAIAIKEEPVLLIHDGYIAMRELDLDQLRELSIRRLGFPMDFTSTKL